MEFSADEFFGFANVFRLCLRCAAPVEFNCFFLTHRRRCAMTSSLRSQRNTPIQFKNMAKNEKGRQNNLQPHSILIYEINRQLSNYLRGDV